MPYIKREVAAQNFFDKASEKFGARYDYSQFEYVNAKTRSTILCPSHGPFEQTPDKHLQATYPCAECFAPIKSEMSRSLGEKSSERDSYPVEEFLSRLELDADLHTIDVSNYGGITAGSVTLNCSLHGETVASPPRNLLLSQYKCVGCARSKTSEALTKSWTQFVEDATKIHGTYTYPEGQEYTNRKSIVEIICPTHGVFKKKAQKHLNGQGCFSCRVDQLVESGVLTGGYNEKLFEDSPEIAESSCRVYYLKVGDLYKIGITRSETKVRVKQIRSDSKKEVTVLKELDCSLREAYTLEKNILKTYSKSRVFRSWSTELFSEDVLRDQDLTLELSMIA